MASIGKGQRTVSIEYPDTQDRFHGILKPLTCTDCFIIAPIEYPSKISTPFSKFSNSVARTCWICFGDVVTTMFDHSRRKLKIFPCASIISSKPSPAGTRNRYHYLREGGALTGVPLSPYPDGFRHYVNITRQFPLYSGNEAGIHRSGVLFMSVIRVDDA